MSKSRLVYAAISVSFPTHPFLFLSTGACLKLSLLIFHKHSINIHLFALDFVIKYHSHSFSCQTQELDTVVFRTIFLLHHTIYLLQIPNYQHSIICINMYISNQHSSKTTTNIPYTFIHIQQTSVTFQLLVLHSALCSTTC